VTVRTKSSAIHALVYLDNATSWARDREARVATASGARGLEHAGPKRVLSERHQVSRHFRIHFRETTSTIGIFFPRGLKKKKRLMPAAGPLAEGRAHAHYRWAERYNDNGDHEKAAAHFGRALDYSDEASFGVAKLTRGKQSTKPWSGVKQAGIKKPEGVRKRDPVKTPDHRPPLVCQVCKQTRGVHWYRDNDHGTFFKLCSECVKPFSGDYERDDLYRDREVIDLSECLEKMPVRYDDHL
jgi:hypothetical protein